MLSIRADRPSDFVVRGRRGGMMTGKAKGIFIYVHVRKAAADGTGGWYRSLADMSLVLHDWPTLISRLDLVQFLTQRHWDEQPRILLMLDSAFYVHGVFSRNSTEGLLCAGPLWLACLLNIDKSSCTGSGSQFNSGSTRAGFSMLTYISLHTSPSLEGKITFQLSNVVTCSDLIYLFFFLFFPPSLSELTT